MTFALIPDGLVKSLEVAEDILVNRTAPPDDEAAYPNRADRVLTQVVGTLLRGQSSIPESQIAEVCALIREPLSRVVELRWRGIVKASELAFGDALSLFEEALREAKRSKIDPWIKRDILLDLRNLETRAAAMRGETLLGYESKWQRQLATMSRWGFHPEIDHQLSRVLVSYMQDTFDLDTDSPLTVRIGDTLPEALSRLSEAMVGSVLTGSYTFLHLLRTLMAYTLYHYFKTSRRAQLLLSSLRLLVTERKIAAVKRIMNSEWSTLYGHVVDNPLAFVASAGTLGDAPEDRVTRCVLLDALSAYVSEADLLHVQEFLLDCVKGPFSMQEQVDVKRAGLRTLRRVVNRLDTSRIVAEVLEAGNDNLLVRDEALKVLSAVDWERVHEVTARRAANQLSSWRRNVLDEGVLYLTLAEIRKAHASLLPEIDRSLYREWQATQSLALVLYFSEAPDALSQQDLALMESRLLRTISDENRRVLKDGSITISRYSEVRLLAGLMERTVNPNWDDLVSVFKEVLTNPRQGASFKYDCLSAVVRLSLTHPSAKRELGVPLNRAIRGAISQVLSVQDDLLFGRGENQKLELKARELSAIVGEVDLDATIPKCVEYGMVPLPDVREASMRLIGAILECDQKGDSAVQLRPYLFSKTFDSWHGVRASAIRLLSKASTGDHQWERICIGRMRLLLDDSSALVRGSVIEICAERVCNSAFQSEYMSMVQMAERDPHYALQARARAILQDCSR